MKAPINLLNESLKEWHKHELGTWKNHSKIEKHYKELSYRLQGNGREIKILGNIDGLITEAKQRYTETEMGIPIKEKELKEKVKILTKPLDEYSTDRHGEPQNKLAHECYRLRNGIDMDNETVKWQKDGYNNLMAKAQNKNKLLSEAIELQKDLQKEMNYFVKQVRDEQQVLSNTIQTLVEKLDIKLEDVEADDTLKNISQKSYLKQRIAVNLLEDTWLIKTLRQKTPNNNKTVLSFITDLNPPEIIINPEIIETASEKDYTVNLNGSTPDHETHLFTWLPIKNLLHVTKDITNKLMLKSDNGAMRLVCKYDNGHISLKER